MGENFPMGIFTKLIYSPLGTTGMGMIFYSPDPIPIGDLLFNYDIVVNHKIFTNKLVKTKKTLKKTLNLTHVLTSAATMTKK